jgi:hypothetical protein
MILKVKFFGVGGWFYFFKLDVLELVDDFEVKISVEFVDDFEG